ncbi:MAG TPA: ribosome biogenesis GTPase YlqF [Pseudogracilibacillus sp.]|nr:ribosome biogenesis GTPase YlqF [Pseudogracilibacillus sp.]
MIQWFPGHMAKARREVEENLKLVDVVVEIVDARTPLSSQNPMLQDVIKEKEKVIVLMKRDLADDEKTLQWLDKLNDEHTKSIAVAANNQNDINKAIQLIHSVGLEAQKRMTDKGVNKRPVRAMMVGIPNVGKSTLINRFVNRKIARIGDRPGITKHQQWIKINKDFELLDTPGILWPKFENPDDGKRLAIIGTIKDNLIPADDVTAFLLTYLFEHYPESIQERYELHVIDDMWEVFVTIGKKRGALESGGHVNFDKVSQIVLRDFRAGKLGKISLE